MSERRIVCCVLTLAAAFLPGCAATSRVDADVSAASLGQKQRGVALMRVGAASPACINVAVLLGSRDGEGFRRGQVVKVANVRSLTDVPVAEVELDPGEHHVLGYACQSDRSTVTVMDKADAQTYRTSYARFTVKAGEVVNVGHLHFGASHVGRSAFGRPLRLDIKVTDWPLREIDQFKARRPALFAMMTTRLMIVNDGGAPAAGEGECARLQALQAAGKVQSLTPACTGLSAPPAATGSASTPARQAKRT